MNHKEPERTGKKQNVGQISGLVRTGRRQLYLGATQTSQSMCGKTSFEYRKCRCMPKFHIAKHRKIERRRTRDGCSGASSMCVPSVGGVLADCGGATAPLLLLRLHPPGPPGAEAEPAAAAVQQRAPPACSRVSPSAPSTGLHRRVPPYAAAAAAAG